MKITLVPYCGLCNRLNMIASAIELRKARPDYEMECFWERDSDCRAWFDDLFLPIEGFSVERLTRLCHVHKGKRFLLLPILLRRFMYDAQLKCRKIASSDVLLHPDQRWKKIYVCGYNELTTLSDYRSLSRLFRPVPALSQRIDAICSQWEGRMVGVHVRRTDHVKVIAHSPMERYVERMRQLAADDEACRFFLATDSDEVKTLLRREFGERIVTLPSLLERDSLEGMQDAVVELFCLGRCTHIIGSSFSTYSRLAAALFDATSEDIETGKPLNSNI